MDHYLTATETVTDGLPRVLVVGGGSIGERHARCFLATKRCRVAVCEPKTERCDQLAREYPLIGAFSSLDEALRLPWSAAVIATPAPYHIPQAMQLLESGAAVLIEKPLSTTLTGIEELHRLAEARRLPVRVAYVYRSHPAVAEMRAALQAGEIGEIRSVTVVGGQHYPTFRPDYRQIYYARRQSGGGVIQDALTHLFDLVAHVVGPFDWVFADWSRQALEGVAVEDTAQVLVRLRGGDVLATFASNQFQAPNEIRIDLHGTRGSLRFEVPRHAWAIQRYGDTDWYWSDLKVRERDELFIRQAHAFLDVMDGKPSALCRLDEAEHGLRVGLAALYSGKRRLPVTVSEVDATYRPDGVDETA